MGDGPRGQTLLYCDVAHHSVGTDVRLAQVRRAFSTLTTEEMTRRVLVHREAGGVRDARLLLGSVDGDLLCGALGIDAEWMERVVRHGRDKDELVPVWGIRVRLETEGWGELRVGRERHLCRDGG